MSEMSYGDAMRAENEKHREDVLAEVKRFMGDDRPEPCFTHDCGKCVYVGHTFGIVGDRQDLYYHHDDKCALLCTVIARWSSDGGDYSSGLSFVGHDPHLTEAYRLAFEKGHVDGSLLGLNKKDGEE